MTRYHLFVSTFLVAQSATASPDNMTVYELLQRISAAAQNADENIQLGNDLRNIVQAELANDSPAFCALDGQGRMDSIVLRDHAIAQVPDPADQQRMAAAPLVIGYLAAGYPCD